MIKAYSMKEAIVNSNRSENDMFETIVKRINLEIEFASKKQKKSINFKLYDENMAMKIVEFYRNANYTMAIADTREERPCKEITISWANFYVAEEDMNKTDEEILAKEKFQIYNLTKKMVGTSTEVNDGK